MAAIRGKDTKPELVVRKGLHARGLRFRLHDRRLPGSPDLIFPSRKLALFVNGCFWHAHEGCRYFKFPKTAADKWLSKLEGNRERDGLNHAELEAGGWRVVVVWECALRTKDSGRISTFLDELAADIRA